MAREPDWIQQKYPGTCAMVAALNAARWWGLPHVPSQDAPEWRRWITRCGAKYGPATHVERLHRHLGLADIRVVPETWAIVDALHQGVPIEATIWLPSEGLHAVLLVPPHRDRRRKPSTRALGLARKPSSSPLGLIRTRGPHAPRSYVREPSTHASVLGMIRTHSPHEPRCYVRETMDVAQLLADHCLPLGNPNRRFSALLPQRRAP